MESRKKNCSEERLRQHQVSAQESSQLAQSAQDAPAGRALTPTQTPAPREPSPSPPPESDVPEKEQYSTPFTSLLTQIVNYSSSSDNEVQEEVGTDEVPLEAVDSSSALEPGACQEREGQTTAVEETQRTSIETATIQVSKGSFPSQNEVPAHKEMSNNSPSLEPPSHTERSHPGSDQIETRPERPKDEKLPHSHLKAQRKVKELSKDNQPIPELPQYPQKARSVHNAASTSVRPDNNRVPQPSTQIPEPMASVLTPSDAILQPIFILPEVKKDEVSILSVDFKDGTSKK